MAATAGIGAGGGPSASTPEQVKLDKECELRVEVSPESPLRLRLLTGTAEIFGTEIPPQIWLSFPPSVKFAVSRINFLILFFELLFICLSI